MLSDNAFASSSSIARVRAQASDALRKTYEAIFDEQTKHFTRDVAHWKIPFLESGALLIARFKADILPVVASDEIVVVAAVAAASASASSSDSVGQHEENQLIATLASLSPSDDRVDDDDDAVVGAVSTMGVVPAFLDVVEENVSSLVTAAPASASAVAAAAPCGIIAEPLTIGFNGTLYEFDPVRQRAIMIGRREQCDIVLAQRNGTSRLHAVVYCAPELGKLLVADMGSATGIVTELRESKVHAKQSSLPGDRRLLEFDWNEGVVLQLGLAKVTIRPRACCVCLDKPRDCMLACNHFVTCKECADKLQDNKCPICRAPAYPLRANVHALASMPIERVVLRR